MDKFIERHNIAHDINQLKTKTGTAKRNILPIL